MRMRRALAGLFSARLWGERGRRRSRRYVAWCAATVLLLVLADTMPVAVPGAVRLHDTIPSLPVAATRTIPRPEYPRPDFARDAWLTLNGAWAFDLDPNEVGQADHWYLYDTPAGSHHFPGRIVVPFPWQSLAAFGRGNEASPTMVNGPLATYQGTVWYARHFRVPGSFPRGDHVVLHAGAAEQSARVWVNGRLAGVHDGGYLPFAVDVTSLVARSGADNTLVIEVTQPANLTGYPHGKQGGFWYSRSGGLWQSVWLEAAGPASIASIRMTPSVQAVTPAVRASVTVAVTFEGARFHTARLTLALADPAGHQVTTRQLALSGSGRGATARLEIPHPLLWDTNHPRLYGLTVTLAPDSPSLPPDTVHTYTGLRTIAVGHVTAGTQRYPYVFLNGRPLYVMGALDQDFNPQGIYTAPSDAFLRDDVLRAKALGLNLLRIHIKAPDPRLLYWADRLGLLIWEEPPDVAEDGASYTPASVARWTSTLHGMMDRDYNHPATVIWGLLNEEWGVGDLRVAPDRARWLAGVYADAKRRDPTRLVVDQSGWSHTRTDVFDAHEYLADFGSWRVFLDKLYDQLYPASSALCRCISGDHDGFVPPATYNTDQPLLMSEYAAGPWTGDWPNKNDERPDGFRDNAAPFRWLTNDLRLHPYVAGYIYTQYSDVEWEHNGLMRYDRVRRHFGYAPPGLYPSFTDTDTPRTVNAADYLAIDHPPITRADPGQAIRVPVTFSHFASGTVAAGGRATLRWRVAGYDGSGVWRAGPTIARTVTIGSGPFSPLGAVVVHAPRGAFAGDVAVWLERGGGRPTVLARNAVALVVAPPVIPGLAVSSRGGRATLTWTVEPGGYARGAFSGTGPVREQAGQAVWGSGSGYLDYRLTAPATATALLRQGRLLGLSFVAEASAQARTSALDESAPQTDDWPRPSRLTVALDGAPLLSRALPDDPSDARGILSLLNGYHWGEYGDVVTATLPAGDARLAAVAATLRRAGGALTLRLAVPASQPGGLTLYGDAVGRVPAPLTLRLIVATS